MADKTIKIQLNLEFDENLRKALAHRWKRDKLPTKEEILDWLTEMLDRDFERILDGAYGAGVIDRYW